MQSSMGRYFWLMPTLEHAHNYLIFLAVIHAGLHAAKSHAADDHSLAHNSLKAQLCVEVCNFLPTFYVCRISTVD